MREYLNKLSQVLAYGEGVDDRTGTGCIQLFEDTTMTFNLGDGFPLLTTKKMAIKNIIRELLWFLSGDTNVRTLQKQGCHIWDGNAEGREGGDLGPIYGSQWRNWAGCIDQIQALVDGLRDNPHSRRHIVTAWNPLQIPMMALPPCHCFFQCHVRDNQYLDMKMYQRSADMFLGVPFNITSYSILLMLLAHHSGYRAGRFIHILGNAHIYKNHIDQVKEQLGRTPKNLPTMFIDWKDDLFSYSVEDFQLKGYDPDPAIRGEMSV